MQLQKEPQKLIVRDYESGAIFRIILTQHAYDDILDLHRTEGVKAACFESEPFVSDVNPEEIWVFVGNEQSAVSVSNR